MLPPHCIPTVILSRDSVRGRLLELVCMVIDGARLAAAAAVVEQNSVWVQAERGGTAACSRFFQFHKSFGAISHVILIYFPVLHLRAGTFWVEFPTQCDDFR